VREYRTPGSVRGRAGNWPSYLDFFYGRGAMAKIGLVYLSDGPYLFYNVESAVGPGAVNRRSDVLLVQYFLREIFKLHSDFIASRFPDGQLRVDGAAGTQTFAAIRHFQMVVARRLGMLVAQDGRVDPPVGQKAAGSLSQTIYTILRMNAGFKAVRPQDWSKVSRASDCPGELRPSIIEPRWA
jgi:hypothetical protein